MLIRFRDCRFTISIIYHNNRSDQKYVEMYEYTSIQHSNFVNIIYRKLELVEQKSVKSIYFDFKEKEKNILTLTVIIDVSSKCQVLFQIEKIKYKFKHNR